MIRPDQIPDDVVHEAWNGYVENLPSKGWEHPSFVGIRAALAAALNAWPMAHIHEWQRPSLGGMSGTDVILPLEEPDVKT